MKESMKEIKKKMREINNEREVERGRARDGYTARPSEPFILKTYVLPT